MGVKSRFHVNIMDLHDEVTGSCHLCVPTFPNGEKLKFIVDCGLFQGNSVEIYNQKIEFNASNVDFCLITHNHVDHIGRTPMLAKNGFTGKVYGTSITCNSLMELALEDSCRVLKGKAKTLGNSPIYTENDVSNILKQCIPCNYNETIFINDHIRVNFFENAHLPGSALILVRISYPKYEDINLLFTGDYNNQNVFLNEVHIPEWVLDLPLTIIQESTYGDITSSDVIPCFDNNILKAAEQGETIIIPAFSLGRCQEVLYRLKCLQDSGSLDKQIPIYLDGKLAISYTNLYIQGKAGIRENMLEFLPENFMYVDKTIRNFLLYQNNSGKIIVTSSGMGSYGPARTYIPAYLGRKNTLIHFTGYTAPGSLGRKLKDTPAGEYVNVCGLLIKKRAKVEYTTEFSAHAKADTMIDFLNQFNNLKLVLVNHGDTSVKESFAKKILEEVSVKQVGILNRDTLFRINTWGLVKTIPTKFI